MPSPRLVPVLALLTLTGVTATAHASAPAGVWGLVDDVTLVPDDINPTMVRIDGVLMIANTLPDFPQYSGYSVPQLGYMYYSCDAKQLATCVMEWKELMALAGTQDNCRGWGDNHLASNGVLRDPQQPMKDPDLYPIAMGVTPGFSPCEALRKWQMENVGESSTGEPGTGSTGGTGEGETGQVSTSVTGSSTDPLPGTTSGEPATSTEAATSTASGTTSPETGDGGATTNTPTSETGAVTGEPGGSTGASGGSTGAPAEPGGDDKGCACDSRGAPGLTGLLGLGLLGLLRRRRAG